MLLSNSDTVHQALWMICNELHSEIIWKLYCGGGRLLNSNGTQYGVLYPTCRTPSPEALEFLHRLFNGPVELN